MFLLELVYYIAMPLLSLSGWCGERLEDLYSLVDLGLFCINYAP